MADEHTLCKTCDDMFEHLRTEIGKPAPNDSSTGGDQRIVVSGRHQQSLDGILEAAQQSCYICGNMVEEIILPRALEHVSPLTYVFYFYKEKGTGQLDFTDNEAGLPSFMYFGTLLPSQHESEELESHSHKDGPAIRERDQADESTGSESALLRAAQWISNCRLSHPQTCSATSSCGQYPSRLLDVSPAGSENLRLIITSDERPDEEYATLSYCWGPNPTFFKLVESNLDKLVAAVPYRNLPRLFRDAILVTRFLGLRYLWIDALCIIQGGARSAEDWQSESRQMASIYSHAALNIAASAATSPHDSLFASRDPSLLRPLRVVRNNPYREGNREILFKSQSMHFEFTYSPLFDRGWVLQERLFSPRILTFGRKRLFWECESSHHCSEFLPLDPTEHFGKYLRNLSFAHPFSLPSPGRNGTDWHHIIRQYTRRELSMPDKDKLVSISGVAQHLSTMLKDQYIFGHFIRSLPQSLAWNVMDIKTATKSTRVPSWSWASINGETTGHISVPYSLEELRAHGFHGQCLAKLTSICNPLCEMGTDFNGDNRAPISLRGLCGQINPKSVQYPDPTKLMVEISNVPHVSLSLDSLQDGELYTQSAGEAIMILVAAEDYSLRHTAKDAPYGSYVCLVLIPWNSEEKKYYKRIGVAKVVKPHAPAIFRAMVPRTIHIA